MKKRYYILCVTTMIIFSLLTYIFMYNSFNTRTKVGVGYQLLPNVTYNVYLKENDIYNGRILGMGKSYVTNLVDYININFDYGILYSEYIYGYYSYSATATLIAYEDDITNSLWEKEYKLIDNKVSVLNIVNNNSINISDMVRINFNDYKKVINDFIDNSKIDVSGYLLVKFNIDTNLDFNKLSDSINDTIEYKMIIPITYDSFKINVVDNEKKTNNYYNFATNKGVNYLFLVLGLMCFSIVVSLMVVVVKVLIYVKRRQDKYSLELKNILKEYGNIIINVKRFYSSKKYNIIYVDSFKELLDVYNKVNKPISYREIRKKYKAMFLIVDDNNAWAYIMKNDEI